MASAKHSNAPAGFNRRSLLKLAPMVPVAAAIGVPAFAAAEETPVMKLFREWEAAMADMAARMDVMSDADFVTLDGQIDKLESEILDEPAQTAQDFIAKIVSWTHGGKFSLPKHSDAPEFWAEACALVA
ncbi:hypothetical protein LO749_18825 [Paracoccus denitrificans]|uniref:hypothetical protein n=1 Tax=Paracoccus denitrificans TaxID=266 RepID=UPI001E2F09C0|nr:hypothetical protein [Paracoccus denitrificans]UFS66560.1 hypothetical protein LO749_18825 [Paracoccus denitrificans]